MCALHRWHIPQTPPPSPPFVVPSCIRSRERERRHVCPIPFSRVTDAVNFIPRAPRSSHVKLRHYRWWVRIAPCVRAATAWLCCIPLESRSARATGQPKSAQRPIHAPLSGPPTSAITLSCVYAYVLYLRCRVKFGQDFPPRRRLRILRRSVVETNFRGMFNCLLAAWNSLGKKCFYYFYRKTDCISVKTVFIQKIQKL